jgi:hypothetical protein
MDSTNPGDPGSLRNSSVLLSSRPGVFSHLPTTRPLFSLEEAHRLLRRRGWRFRGHSGLKGGSESS